MVIDARAYDDETLFRMLRDIIAEAAGKEIELEIFADSKKRARAIRTFAEMSLCSCGVEEKDGLLVLRVSGSPCSCGLR